MQNLETVFSRILTSRLPRDICHSVVSAFPVPTLHSLHYSETSSSLATTPLDPPQDTLAYDLPLTAPPVALTLHNEKPLIACRDGAVVTLLPNGPDHVGDFTDDDPTRSGVLAACASPDGCLLVVVSPVSVTVLDADFAVVAEVPCEGVADRAQVVWRSDGEFFAVARGTQGVAEGLVADRACEGIKKMQMEASIAHEVCITWEPRVGGMIGVAAGKTVIFFERNGLRHRRSDFSVGHQITQLKWNCDARILAAVGDGFLSLWVRCNACWYCKKLIKASDLVDVLWDEDEPGLLRTVLKDGRVREMRLRTLPSTPVVLAAGPVLAVVHGSRVVLTNVAAGIVPPPMHHGMFNFESGVDALCSDEESGMLGALLFDGSFETVEVKDRLDRPQMSIEHDVIEQDEVSQRFALAAPKGSESSSAFSWRWPVLLSETLLAVVRQCEVWSDKTVPNDSVVFHRLKVSTDVSEALCRYQTEGQVTAMVKARTCPCGLIIATSGGTLVKLNVYADSSDCEELGRMKCLSAETACSVSEFDCGSRSFVVVHEEGGRLDVAEFATGTVVTVSDECTSYILLQKFLIFTTRSNVLYCVLLEASSKTASQPSTKDPPSLLDAFTRIEETGDKTVGSGRLSEGAGAIRPIDRGSLIVGKLPDGVSILLQAPRGNLECIAPRPVVLNAVETLASNGEYGKAFSLCRRQRVDMNLIVDANSSRFLDNVNKFVAQVPERDHLSVFMTFLKGDQDKINTVCKAIVQTLRARPDGARATTAILTGMIRQKPSDFEGAMDEVMLAVQQSEENGRAAVDFLFILVKKEELVYQYALGTYNLELAEFVAEASQMDPAEYRAELERLRLKDDRERKYAIDTKLERYDRALQHLHAGGEENYGKCVSLCLEHSLYITALDLFQEQKNVIPVLLEGYGGDLRRKERFDEAAAVFQRIGNWQNACSCYRESGRWQVALNAVSQSSASAEEKLEVYNAVADELLERSKICEAARVRAMFLQDVTGAVDMLLDAEEWETALEFVAMQQLGDKSAVDTTLEGNLWSALVSGVAKGGEALIAVIKENSEKLRQRRQRLIVVRTAKEAMREQLGRANETGDADSEVFSATTASSTSSRLSDITFTSKTSATSLYTTSSEVGPLSSAKLEKQAMRRKQKASRKRIREGHPREEEALVGYLQRLIPGEFLFDRVDKCIRALLYVQEVHLACRLAEDIGDYVAEALRLPADISEAERPRLEKYEEHRCNLIPSGFLRLDARAVPQRLDINAEKS